MPKAVQRPDEKNSHRKIGAVVLTCFSSVVRRSRLEADPVSTVYGEKMVL